MGSNTIWIRWTEANVFISSQKTVFQVTSVIGLRNSQVPEKIQSENILHGPEARTGGGVRGGGSPPGKDGDGDKFFKKSILHSPLDTPKPIEKIKKLTKTQTCSRNGSPWLENQHKPLRFSRFLQGGAYGGVRFGQNDEF